MPAQHMVATKLPAVSGSSGRLVVVAPAEARNTSPGQVFADLELDYAMAMTAYVAASVMVYPGASHHASSE